MMLAKQSSGFAYLEIIVATLLLAILLVPALDSLYTSFKGGDVISELSEKQYDLNTKMEDVLAESFDDLADAAETAGMASVPSSYSEDAGTPDRKVVFLSHYDGDTQAFTTDETGLIWVRLVVEGGSEELYSLVARE